MWVIMEIEEVGSCKYCTIVGKVVWGRSNHEKN